MRKPGRFKRFFSWQAAAQAALLLAVCGILLFFARAYFQGSFRTLEGFQEYIAGFGPIAPLVLILLQFGQVVFPFLPAAVGYAAGTALFGWLGGFLCNYIGIFAGSCLAFYLARRFGSAFVRRHVSPAKYEKYSAVIGRKGFTLAIGVLILLPVAPDDLLCYLAGLTPMSWKRFLLILLTLKPWCLLLYSLFFAHILKWSLPV